MPEKLKNLLDSELERLMALLPENDPTTEGYNCLLTSIFRINDMIEMRRFCSAETGAALAPAETPAGVHETAAPATAPEEDQPVVDTDDLKGETEYINPEDLRAALADAKKKGVNISELINSLGAPNFSGLRDDQDKLRQLKTLMENALKEIA